MWGEGEGQYLNPKHSQCIKKKKEKKVKKKIIQKHMHLLFFHEESIYEVSRRFLIPEYHRVQNFEKGH